MKKQVGEKKIRGPNKEIGYFPFEKDLDEKNFPKAISIEACERAFKKILRKFDVAAVGFLRKTLQDGRVNGCFHKSDLVGTLAKAQRTTSNRLLKKIGHVRDLQNPAEYWFFQIGGWRTLSPNGKPPEKPERCLFTEIAIR